MILEIEFQVENKDGYYQHKQDQYAKIEQIIVFIEESRLLVEGMVLSAFIIVLSYLFEGTLVLSFKLIHINCEIYQQFFMLKRVFNLLPLKIKYSFSITSIQAVLKQYSQELADSQTMQSMIPRQYTENKLTQICDNQRFSQGNNHLQSLTKTFSQPIWQLLDRGGKRWRPVLCLLLAELLGHNRSLVLDIAGVCQITHNGTLMVDDIQDSSTMRRNKPCIHLLFGVDIAVNAGNMMYFSPMLTFIKSKKYSPDIMLKLNQIYLEEMVNLHVGQGWDILWHNIDKLQRKYPTEDQYLQMTAHKTGVLPRLSSRMVCTALSATEKQSQALSNFVEDMGVAFQIQDDILNLQGEYFKKTKGYNGQDIHQGKITLMVIHHLQKSANPDELINILKKRTEDQQQIKRAISLLNQTGSIEYARNRMNQIIVNSCSKLNNTFPQSSSRQMLKQLAYFGIKRQK